MIKTINTGISELVLVKVPDKSHKHLFTKIHGDNDLVFYIENEFPKVVTIPDGKYELLGIAHDLTEEVWRKIVKTNFRFNIKYNTLFLDYSTMHFKFKTATESGLSMLRANEIYDVNPYGEECRSYSEVIDGADVFELKEDMDNWTKAQQNTGKWVVLRKTN